MPQQGFQPSNRSLARTLRFTGLSVAVVGTGLWVGQAALDASLRQGYRLWKPILERQVSRVMGHPFHLGPYQGLGWGGVRLGPTRLDPGPLDRSWVSATGGAVSLDPIASLRQGVPVLQISLEGVRSRLQPNRQGQWWVMGELPPGAVPPRLDLRFRLRQPAQLTLARARQSVLVRGRFAVQPHRHRLQLQVGVSPHPPVLASQGGWGRADSGSLAFALDGNWQQRLWQARLRLARLSMAALGPSLGLQSAPGLSGQLDGDLVGRWQAGTPSCQGSLRLTAGQWPFPVTGKPNAMAKPQAKPQTLQLPRLDARCQAQALRVTPAPWRLGRFQGQVAAKAHWHQGGFRVDQLRLQSGSSWLQAQGTIGRRLDWRGQWQAQLKDWLGPTAVPPWLSQSPIAGSVRLAGTAAQPQLSLQAEQRRNPVLGPWRSDLQWRQDLLQLDRFSSSVVQASGSLPLAIAGRQAWRPGELDLQVALARVPLSRLSPLVGAPLQGMVAAEGRVHGPLGALTPDLHLRLDQPGAGPLALDESWVGDWYGDPAGGGRLAMQALAPAPEGTLTARLDRHWVPTAVTLQRGEGSLRLQGRPRAYRWTAERLPLTDLQLALGPRQRPQPLAGALSGSGQLSLQPLAFAGQVSLERPVLLGVWARTAALKGHYADRRFQVSGSLEPLGGGQLGVDWSGRWMGPFRATLQGRQLSDRFWRQLAMAWPQWLGTGLGRQGQATDLGPLTIQSLGQSLQQQLALLANAKAQLESSETALEASRTPLQRLEQIGAAVDLDLSLAGPSLLSARTDLAARAHLWLNANDRDAVLTQQPVLLSFQGQLLAGDGQFSLSGLPLALLALLTPVPEGLRGNLQAQGQLRLGRRSDQLEVTLALSDAALKDTALTLQRGRVVLQDQMLVLDLALHGSGANNSLEMAGRVPLDPSSPELELRVASRDDGLRFLTHLAEPAVSWTSGKADLQLLVRGSLQDPIANGFVRLRGGELQCFGQRVEAVEALALFDFQQVVVQELAARVGSAGSIRGKGTLGLLRPVAGLPGLNLTVKTLPFTLPKIKAVANGQLHLDGSLNALSVGGDLAISKGSINVAPSEMAPANGSRKPVVAVSTLLEERWNFQQPLLLLGTDGLDAASGAASSLVPNVPALGFNNLRFTLGPDLTVGVPNLASFATAGSLRLNGRLDPSLTVSGLVRLQRGRLNLFTTNFSLDPDAPNVAIFTPSLGLVPYLDIALRTRVSDSLRVPGNTLGTPLGPSLTDFANQGTLSSLNQLNLVRVYLSVSGPADRLARSIRLRSSPPLPEERLLALIGGNTLAGLAAGQAGAAIATALGQTLLSPVLGGLSDALGQRVSFALYPTYVNSQVSTTAAQRSGRVPTQLVLGSEVGLDITQRFNASILAAPNRSDVPPQLNLNYKASELINLQGSIDSQGAMGAQLQLFLRF